MPDLTILHRDDHLLALAKPPGWESVVKGTGGHCFTTLARRTLQLTYCQPAHRLDRDTSGVQILALSEEALHGLETAFRDRLVTKQYLALCLGVPNNPTGTIRRNLSQWGGGRKAVQVVKGRGGLQAETTYTRLAFTSPNRLAMGGRPGGGSRGRGVGELERQGVDRSISPSTHSSIDSSMPFLASLLLFAPHQGRTHQVRVHAAAFGYPILADDQYGDRPANKALKELCGLRRQALHAWRYALPHPVTRERLALVCPPPDDLAGALDLFIPDWQQVLAKVPL